MADLWLKANYPLGPFPSPPVDQAVADVLANSPYAAWRTGRVAFTYEFVDRPEAGTALLAIVNPPTRQTPSDGLRYMYAEPNEIRTMSQHTVSVPSSFTNPGQSRKEEVVLECYTAMAGHFPPISPSQPLTPDSPEMRLTRYRKRWRITNGQYPGLWFYYWGRDEFGGFAGNPAPTAPAGWDRTPARAYPLVRPPNFPTAPLFPFPDQSRVAAGQTGPAPPPPPATPQQVPPLAAGTPNAANPYAARQQQLAALAASHTPLGMSTSNPALEARQQQFQAQQAAMMAAQQRGYPQYGMTPQQMQMQAHQAQMIAAQQQQQQQQHAAAAQAAQAAAQAAAAQAAARNQRKPLVAVPPSAQLLPSSSSAAPASSSSGPNIAAAVPPQHEDETPLTDIFDLLTPRQLAIHRYAKQHDLLAPLFDAWDVNSIAGGGKRKREVDELVKSNGISARLGEPRQGVVPGLGREGALGVLGTSAARVAVYGALGKRPEKATMGMEVGERRKRLERMLGELEGQCEGLERKNEEQVGKLRRATEGEVGVAAA